MQESADVFFQLTPGIILGLLYAVVVFIVARKRKINPWGWTIATLVPFIGLLVSAVFFLVTLLSILDRLDTLEASLTRTTAT
jgi:ATP/ADP translocase